MPLQLSTEILAERLRALLPPDRVVEKRMFGGLAFMLDGHMLCCVSKLGVMFRVGADAEPAALARPHAKPCLGTGRPMAGFIMVDGDGLSAGAALAEWVTLARAYVGTLAPKPSKGAARRTGPKRRNVRGG